MPKLETNYILHTKAPSCEKHSSLCLYRLSALQGVTRDWGGGGSWESCAFAITQPAFINTLPLGNTIPAAQHHTTPAPAGLWLHLLLLPWSLPASPCVQKGNVQHTDFLNKGGGFGSVNYTCVVN